MACSIEAHLAPWFNCKVKVAVSGGGDSTALLAAVIAQRANFIQVSAEYLNHGWSSDADEWGDKIAKLCAVHSVSFDTVQLPDASKTETKARLLRYDYWQGSLQVDQVLLLGHTLDDQADTLVLRMLRGTGVRGLAGIPQTRTLGKGVLARPFLQVDRQALRDYLNNLGIDWLQDPSNTDSNFARGWLRVELAEPLSRRYPAWREQMSHLARSAQDNNALLEQIAEQDLRACSVASRFPDHYTLATNRLPQSRERRDNLLTHWIRQTTGDDIPRTRRLRLEAMLEKGELDWTSRCQRRWCLRKWRNLVWLFQQVARQPVPGESALAFKEYEKKVVLYNSRVSISLNGVEQVPKPGNSLGWKLELCQPGERMQLAGRPEKSMHTLLAEAGVPPWLRSRALVLRAHGDKGICYLQYVGWSQTSREKGFSQVEVSINQVDRF